MFNSRKCPVPELAEYIGGLQRNAFERTGRTDRAVTLDEIMSHFDVSYGTAAAAVKELRRCYGADRLRDRKLPQREGGRPDGKVISGRPLLGYYFVDGHRWDGAGKPLAHMVLGQGGRSVAMSGWSGAMSVDEVKFALRAERAWYGRPEFNTYLSARYDSEGFTPK